ncbi:MAG: hypothetical protein QW724_08230, partial [Nitrososphaerota archaeon]
FMYAVRNVSILLMLDLVGKLLYSLFNLCLSFAKPGLYSIPNPINQTINPRHKTNDDEKTVNLLKLTSPWILSATLCKKFN